VPSPGAPLGWRSVIGGFSLIGCDGLPVVPVLVPCSQTVPTSRAPVTWKELAVLPLMSLALERWASGVPETSISCPTELLNCELPPTKW
jgi:hypothetical protein